MKICIGVGNGGHDHGVATGGAVETCFRPMIRREETKSNLVGKRYMEENFDTDYRYKTGGYHCY